MGELRVDGERLERELKTLAGFTHVQLPDDGTAVTRVVFTEDDLAARRWLRELALAEGFGYRVDAVGNTFIRLAGEDETLPAVATGSHLDAIPHAGMYDGTVGVLGGFEALRAVRGAGARLRRAIELVVFTAEEPTRFGLGCLGSRLMGGALDARGADGLKDLTASRGEIMRTLAEVRRAAGFAGDLGSARLEAGAYAAFVELHIEQGPLLEREDQQIGIVTSIAAPASYRFAVEGYGGHAGALLMPDRKDALCAAAELILAVERSALKVGTIDTVATVGTCAVHPGAVNSVPSRVGLELDLRDTDPARREQVMEAIRTAAGELAERRGVRIVETLINADAPAACDAGIVEAIARTCEGRGISTRRMVSRAYHDTLFMAPVCPVGIIFIPCRNGISHRPDEYAAPEDIARGATVLAEVLAGLASR